MLTSSSPNDEQLLQRISQGISTALAELYDRYAPRAYGLILQIVKNQTDAEDVLQETFLQIWQQSHRFDVGKAKPEVWILLLARSRAIDRLRKKQSRTLASYAQSSPPEGVEQPGDLLVRNESQKLVCSALCKLPHEQLEPIRLAFFEGMTHLEISHQLKLPLGTIKTRIRSGMQRLRGALVARGVGHEL